jgi:indoleamine 2,3-dioxygenase
MDATRIAAVTLATYNIDPASGFLPTEPPLSRLPEEFAPWEQLVPQLSALIRSRRVRAALEVLSLLDVSTLITSAQLERAMLLLSVFGNSYVWGGEEPALRIPRSVAVPLCAVANVLDRPPITHYASMALNNWQLLDPRQPLSVSNARMQVQFLGGVDEDWFFIASIGVELAGAPLLPLVVAADEGARSGEDAQLAGTLGELADGVTRVIQALERIREWCDPHTYYLRVRPYLSGWPGDGVVYEQVSEQPRKYVGGSAGQSSLLQVLDAVLGIDHGDSPAGRYLRSIRAYMPVEHRRFVTDIERSSQVRARAARGSAALRAAYNGALNEIARFRQHHVSLAQDYILKPSGMNLEERGTGGTTLANFLHGTQDATTRSKL